MLVILVISDFNLHSVCKVLGIKIEWEIGIFVAEH